MKRQIYGAASLAAITRLLNARATKLAGLAVFLLAGLTQSARAQNYWDVNGAAAGLGGSGNWDLATANWNDATGTSAPYVWPNTATSDAVFTGTSGTVTLVVSGVQVRNMDFLTDGYVLNTNNSSTLALAAGGSTVNVANGTDSATISVALTGTGTTGLTKVGAGVLSLTGTNTYTGATNINAGSLFVDGSIASANTFVSAGGLLGGIGTIGGSVNNSGIVSPGHPVGTLTISGSYTQTSTGMLRTEIGGLGPSQHDLLQMAASAMLNGRLDLVRINNFTPVNGDQVTILTASTGVTGRFSTVTNNFPSAPAAIVIYDPTDVRVVFLTFATLPGLTPNQREVAEELDKVANDALSAKMITFLVGQPLIKLPHDFDLIAPEELASIYELGFSQATLQSINLQRRMDDIRAGSTGFSSNGFAPTTTSYGGGKGADNKNVVEKNPVTAFTPSPENPWGFFITGTGQFVDVDNQDENARGYDIVTGGVTLGLDYRITPNFAIGVDGSYARSDVDLVNDGRVKANSGRGGLYATYFAGGFYLDAAGGAGYSTYNTRRTGLGGNARADTNGQELNALVATGYDWKVGPITFGPIASFHYTRIHLDDFTESGSLAPLSFPDQSEDSKRSTAGLKLCYEFKVGSAKVKPEVRASWQHEFGDAAYAIDSRFASGAGNIFTVHGPEIGRDSALISGGIGVQWSERVGTYVNYDGQLARDNYNGQSVSAGVRVSF